MNKFIASLLLFLYCSVVVKGQPASSSSGFDLEKTFPTPDVASLGTFALVPANTFNGQANISIPLYNISYKKLEVPILMSYSTSGLKVDEHPGWLGIGWNLQAGGAIYRKVNGICDEHTRRTPSNTYTNEIGYYYTCGKIPANFNNLEAIRQYSLDGNVDVLANAYDANPDEFIFNFNGYSGVFYFTRPFDNGPLEIKIRPNGAYRLKAEILEIRDFIEFDDWFNTLTDEFETNRTERSIYSIKITDDNGIQYFFGGNPNSIEFSNNGNLSDDLYTISNAWHLTEIRSPEGYKIELSYKRPGRVFVQNKQRNALFYSGSYNYGDVSAIPLLLGYFAYSGTYSYSGELENIAITVQNPVYLSSIKTPSQTINFNSSRTSELDYPFDLITLNNLTSPDFHTGADESFWQKLDEIDILGHRKIKFNYRNEISKRLRLNSLELHTNANEIVSSYSFEYNDLSLPPYNSRMADHWGYYNGRSYAYGNDYMTLREPDPNYLQAEMLEKITYPTGGFLFLEYEPHYYKKVARQFPFVVDIQSANLLAGGLRVKKITSAANAGETPMSKEYFYVQDYINGGTNSSGVLSGLPKYSNTGSVRRQYQTGIFWDVNWGDFELYHGKVVDNNYLVLGNTNGSHVTYSEVTEKSGNGYMVYKYTNHDNGFSDMAPYKIHTNFTSEWHEEGFISKEMFRGLLTATEIYNQNKAAVKSVLNEYFIDDISTDYQVPYFYRIYDESIGVAVWLSRVSTCVHFTKPPLIRKTTEIEYFPGTAQTITTATEYKYFPDVYPTASYTNDNYKVAEIKVTSSKSEALVTKFSYPYDMVAASLDPSGVYQGMINRNIVSPVIEERKLRAGIQTNLSRTKYYSPFTNVFVPQTIEIKNLNHSSETRFRFYEYDSYGNVLSQSAEDDVPSGFIWGYAKQYPTAKVINAKSDQIFFESFEEGDGWDGALTAYDNLFKHTGLASGRINKPSAGELTSHSTKWLNISLTEPTKFKYSGWVYSNGPSAEIFLFMKRAGETGYFTHVASKQTTETNKWVYLEGEYTVPSDIVQLNIRIDNNGGGMVWFDDIRLHPANAQMTTYAYEPLIGITSQCDINNRLTYYEYDNFGRLIVVRDHDRNILKRICYNYTGQPENCLLNTNPNWQSMGNYRCIVANGEYTGEQEREERDTNPYSITYNQTQWVSNGQNMTACPPPIYAKIFVTDIYNDYAETTATILIKFFRNADCTIPLSVNNLNVNYKEVRTNCAGGGTVLTTNHSVNCSGTQTSLGTQTISWDDGLHCWNFTFSVTAGIGYEIGN